MGFSVTTVCDEEGRRSLKRIATVIGFLKSTGVKQNAKVTTLCAVVLLLVPLASRVSTTLATAVLRTRSSTCQNGYIHNTRSASCLRLFRSYLGPSPAAASAKVL